ncbi:MAG TPA: response regulator [Syntrophomonadaceae bacterium]|nr:response regulator [Syntrophomonadaceae bacterium]
MKYIKVILADDNDDIRAGMMSLLELDASIDVVGEARNGIEALEQVARLKPEIIIMDINMPGMDGIEAAKLITREYPAVSVIIASVDDEISNFRRAMMAGAKEYLVKPLSADELHTTIHQVAELNRNLSRPKEPEQSGISSKGSFSANKIISVFGTKGGVGKSIICTNLAVAAAQKHKCKVALVDLDIQFGDVSILMNLDPRKTILELIQEGEEPGKELLEDYLYERNGVNILAAPTKPELAELVSPAGVGRILKMFRGYYNYTFVDTPSFIDETTLTALEISDLVLLVITLDLPTIKNVKKGIDILRSLNMLNKIRLVLNRSSGMAGIEPKDVERVLEMPIRAEVPSDGKLVIASVNQGIPFVKMNPKAPISKGIINTLQILE